MLIPDDLASNSLLISSGTAIIAVFLGLRQWYEWRARERDLSDVDRGYFFRQDVRRGLGVAVILILAGGLYIGSRIPPKVAGHANLTFVEIWLAIIGLIVVLLILALIDWLSTRLYARRQRRSMAQERMRILRDALRKVPTDKHSEIDDPPIDPSQHHD
jgi:hypothetical protein